MDTKEQRNVKQVIVFRKDLLKGEHAIRKGKFAAQCCHASMGSLLQLSSKEPMENGVRYSFDCIEETPLDIWLNGIFTKVVVSIDDNESLVKLYDTIRSEAPQIPCALITDCGLTEFHGQPTNTCLGIGPWYSEEIDTFTKELKLL